LAIETLLSSLMRLARSLERKAKEFDTVVKIGRTHLMDAVPVRLGQEFAGYADQVTASYWGLLYETEELYKNLAIGGTAVGTGLNAPKNFGRDVCRVLRKHIGLFKRGGSAGWGETKGRFAQLGAKDAVVSAAGALKRTALVLGKIASDIRLMGSGPRCGLGELVLPAVQPGSSIMPGKVNPVICESVIQVACQVVGCDAAITAGAMGGVGSILELNVAMPMIAWNLLTASKLLTNAATTFEEKCVRGLKANAARCEELVEQSLAMVTALAPKLGYDLAAEIAKEAMESGKTIREICIANKVLPTAELNRLLDARKQTGK
jgi:fumarate hydratase class II